MYRKPPAIKGLDFTEEEIESARKNKRLLSFDLELTRLCNLRCIYCYTGAGEKPNGEISLKDILSTIDQAKELGAKNVVVIGGGEPFVYRDYFKVIDHINKKGLDHITFTNGTRIDKKTAKMLVERKASLCIKLNSLNPTVHDKLCGARGAHKKAMEAISLLLDLGYTKKNMPQLCIESIISKYNYGGIKELWVWARERNIVPYIELPTLQGRATKELTIEPQKAKNLFTELREIDRKKYGFDWPLTPPIAAQVCRRHYFGCYVTSKGDVQPCAGIEIPIGNIKKDTLRHILENSKEIEILRNIGENIKGRCKTCAHHHECYGCRGKAFQEYADFTMPDPSCWNNCPRD